MKFIARSAHVCALLALTIFLRAGISRATATAVSLPLSEASSCSAAQRSADATSLMQGVHVHVDQLSSRDVKLSPLHASRVSKSITDKVQQTTAGSASLQGRLADFPRTQGVLEQMSTHILALKGGIQLSIVVALLLVVVMLVASCSVFRRDYEDQRRQAHASTAAWPIATPAGRRPASLVTNVMPTHPTNGTYHRASTIGLGMPPTPHELEPTTSMPATPPTPVAHIGSQMQEDLFLRPEPHQLPPALCEQMVLPMCEVRFGVALESLLNLQVDKDLKIVGLSGNTLLRANVQKAGTGLALAILMPEAASTARAIVRQSQHDPEVFEISGFKGADYGLLHTRRTSVGYVTHKGRIVLTIDGKFDLFQMWLKSDVDDEQSLASVQLCCESFANGKEHLQIRVQPGVDSVLVLSCVLAVLLLSPHHGVARSILMFPHAP